MKPNFTSRSGPASQWTGARSGPVYLAFSASYLIDIDNAVILDVEATRPISQTELGAVQVMVLRIELEIIAVVACPHVGQSYGAKRLQI